VKILIIEDENALLESISSYLLNDSNICEKASTYNEAEDKLSVFNYDVIILDLTLPGGNGLDLIPLVKKLNPRAGLLILSAKNSLDDKITGLDSGADDYLTKPFHLAELNSRIKSLARRRIFEGTNTITFNEIIADIDSGEVYINGKAIELTRREYEILLYFLSNRNKVISMESLAEHVLGDYSIHADNFDFLYGHIKNLRRKIQNNNGNNYLHNIYGLGYKFSEK
jgi:DNA-binding response OmpR family regulator